MDMGRGWCVDGLARKMYLGECFQQLLKSEPLYENGCGQERGFRHIRLLFAQVCCWSTRGFPVMNVSQTTIQIKIAEEDVHYVGIVPRGDHLIAGQNCAWFLLRFKRD